MTKRWTCSCHRAKHILKFFNPHSIGFWVLFSLRPFVYTHIYLSGMVKHQPCILRQYNHWTKSTAATPKGSDLQQDTVSFRDFGNERPYDTFTLVRTRLLTQLRGQRCHRCMWPPLGTLQSQEEQHFALACRSSRCEAPKEQTHWISRCCSFPTVLLTITQCSMKAEPTSSCLVVLGHACCWGLG